MLSHLCIQKTHNRPDWSLTLVKEKLYGIWNVANWDASGYNIISSNLFEFAKGRRYTGLNDFQKTIRKTEAFFCSLKFRFTPGLFLMYCMSVFGSWCTGLMGVLSMPGEMLLPDMCLILAIRKRFIGCCTYSWKWASRGWFTVSFCISQQMENQGVHTNRRSTLLSHLREVQNWSLTKNYCRPAS